jgi:hypothetical protein
MGLRKTAALVMGGLLLCSPGILGAQEVEVSPDALRGLKGVGVIVQPLDEKLQMAGLRQVKLRELTEGELKTAGIPVLHEGEEVPPAAPALEITLTAVREPQGTFYIFDLDFKLRRGSLVRRGQAEGAADAGWRRHWNGLVAVNKLDEIDTRLRGFLQEFTSAYRSVNRPSAKRGAGE